MKLDDLLTADSGQLNPAEWRLGLAEHSVPGLYATFVNGHWMPNGDAYLSFAFTATQPLALTGMKLNREWTEGPTRFIRTCRLEVWAPPYVMNPGSVMAFDLIIEPKEWE